jgi:hypothetical protein
VRDLEDKFHGLELHHVLRDDNADVLQRPCPVAARCLTGSSRVINMRHPYERRARSHPRSQSPRSWQSTSLLR